MLMEMRVWNLISELQLPNDNARMDSDSLGKQQNSLLRIERSHPSYEAVQFQFWNQKLRCGNVSAKLRGRKGIFSLKLFCQFNINGDQSIAV